MKKFISVCLLVVMIMSFAATAFAGNADIREFAFSFRGADAQNMYFQESSQTATKYGSNYKYGSFRVQSWNNAKPKKNIYVGLNFQGYIPACSFVWLNVSKSLSIRVTPKLNDPSKVGSGYKYCAAMRINTDETAASVKPSGIFTPDGK